ncbi:MAG: GntR family transcriptional regulator [Sphaerochaetaceae bacterium]|jgi:DNA-binding GntR family transcriptional regulator
MVYEKIRDKIINCEYSPGTLLKEDILKEEYAVSRTPVREALARLENEGLIVIKPKKGILVSPITIEEANEIFEIRELFETYALRAYGRQIQFSILKDFYVHTSLCDPATIDRFEFFKLDDEIHQMLLDPVKNTYIHRTYETILAQNNRLRYITGSIDENRIAETKKEHLLFLKSCIDNDWESAEYYLRDHLRKSRTTVFNYLLTNQGSEG